MKYDKVQDAMTSLLWHQLFMIAFSKPFNYTSMLQKQSQGMLTMFLVTKTRTMKPDERTLAIRYKLEEEKNRPSGQCAVELSPAV